MRLKPGKITLTIFITVSVLLIAVFFAISPVAKYVVEKNSEEWTGRKITMNGLFINLLKLNITVKGLKVYEPKSSKVFFSAGKFQTGMRLLQLIKGEYMIPVVILDSPELVIEQQGTHFNFDDLVTRFTATDTTAKEPETTSEPVKYHIQNIEITNGSITYRDKDLNNEIVMQQFKFGCPSLSWNSPVMNAATEFELTSGGKADARIALNLDSLSYLLDINIDKFDMSLLMPYMKDYLITSYTGGLLSSKLKIKGDFDIPEAVALKGDISLSELRIDDQAKVTVASWKNLSIGIDSLDVAGNIYNFGVLRLDDPYLLFEYYDKSDNFSQMMPPSEPAISDSSATDEIDYSNPFTIMADYVEQISRDYIISNYTAKNLLIHNGHIVYRDYTLEDKFVYDLLNLELASGRIDSKSDSVSFDLSCLANRSGKLNAHLAFDPRDYMNMSINYSIEKMRIADFNPYSKFYVAHAFVEGLLFYNSTNTIRNGKLNSTNVMSIKKIEVSRKMNGVGLYEMPLRLAIAVLRDRKGNIELDIPVEGDLKDPSYKLGKIIWQIVKNLVVKAATAPFDLLAKAFGHNNEEDLKVVRFDYLQKKIDDRQLKNLENISKILDEKPEIKVSLVQVASRDSEKELLALSLAKGAYYKKNLMPSSTDSLDAKDLEAIAAISGKDSLFNIWLNQQFLPEDVSLMPSQLKCRKLYGETILEQEVDKLFAIRNKMILDFLVNEKHIDPLRIKITNTADEDSAQFESTPRYTVELFVDE